jgi:hypothetical protein
MSHRSTSAPVLETMSYDLDRVILPLDDGLTTPIDWLPR